MSETIEVMQSLGVQLHDQNNDEGGRRGEVGKPIERCVPYLEDDELMFGI